MNIEYRLGSYLLISAGLACILLLIFGDYGKLIIADEPNPVLKYMIIILLCDGAITFPFFGIMFLMGKLTPWYDPEITDVDKARLYVYSAIATFPFNLVLVIMLISANVLSKFIAVAVMLMLIWFFYCLVKSIFILSRNHKR